MKKGKPMQANDLSGPQKAFSSQCLYNSNALEPCLLGWLLQ